MKVEPLLSRTTSQELFTTVEIEFQDKRSLGATYKRMFPKSVSANINLLQNLLLQAEIVNKMSEIVRGSVTSLCNNFCSDMAGLNCIKLLYNK